MKCLSCGAEGLVATVVLSIRLPLAKRNGTVTPKGSITQKDIKDAWDTIKGEPKATKSPIECLECGAEHIYVTGTVTPLRLVEAQ